MWRFAAASCDFVPVTWVSQLASSTHLHGYLWHFIRGGPCCRSLVAFMHKASCFIFYFFLSPLCFLLGYRPEHYTVSLLGKAREHMKEFLSIYFPAFCVTTKVRNGRIQMLRDQFSIPRALAGLCLYSKEGIGYICKDLKLFYLKNNVRIIYECLSEIPTLAHFSECTHTNFLKKIYDW